MLAQKPVCVPIFPKMVGIHPRPSHQPRLRYRTVLGEPEGAENSRLAIAPSGRASYNKCHCLSFPDGKHVKALCMVVVISATLATDRNVAGRGRTGFIGLKLEKLVLSPIGDIQVTYQG